MSIKKDLKIGIVYNFVTKYSNMFIFLIVNSILARLISPEDFGVFAIIFVIINLFNMISEMGLGPAIIQSSELDENDINNLFGVTVVFSMVFSFIFAICGGGVAEFYNNDIYINITKILSLTLFFNILTIVPLAKLRKKLEFKKVGSVYIFANLISGGFAVFLAMSEFRYYSLVYQSIAKSLIVFILIFYTSKMKVKLKLDFCVLKKIYKFSTLQFISNLISYFSRNITNLVLGKYVGMGALGYYEKSYTLTTYPIQIFTNIVSPVIHPVLSKQKENKKEIIEIYYKLLNILAWIGFPLSVFLFSFSEEIILIIYGKNWFESVILFKILSISIGFQMLTGTIGGVFQAFNKLKWLLIIGIQNLLFVLGAIYFGNKMGGVKGITILLVVAFIVNFLIVFFVLNKFIFEIGLNRLFYEIKKPIMVSLSLGTIKLLMDKVPQIDNFLLEIMIMGSLFLAIVIKTEEYKKISKILR